MSAQVIPLFQQSRQPAAESFADLLRRLADQYEAGQLAGASVIVTDYNGRVETHHSDDAPELTSRRR